MSTRDWWVLFDWGGTLMSEDGPLDIPMALWPEVREIPGARETLATLSRDCRLGVVTNASVSTRNMIEVALGRVGLRELVSEIFCYTELGLRKDSPAFWRHVLERTGADAARVVVVGDTLEQDVIGPREAGLFSIWFDAAGSGAPHAYPVIHDLAELVPIVRSLQEQER
jgi:FMN phosphatase YigB (HAD superfamily)